MIKVTIPLSRIVVTLAVFALGSFAHASVTVYDNIISLATNGTKTYTFTDNFSGQSATVAVTMTAYSTNATRSFSLLDQDSNGNFIRMGVDSATGGGDANWVDWYEGANFSASIVSASSSTASNAVRFQIAGIGMRPNSDIPVSWTSSATSTRYTAPASESLVGMDTGSSALAGTTYSGYLRGQFTYDVSQFQFSDNGFQGLAMTVSFSSGSTSADPRTNSWFTAYSGQYARIYTSDVNRTNGTTATTWSIGSTTQALPVYCGVQEVYSSSNSVYVRSTGLAGYTMGAWYTSSAHTSALQQYPINQKLMYRIPRTNSIPTKKTLGGGGAAGVAVDGVAVYNTWDAFIWNGTVEATSTTNGYWNRDAYINEGTSVDPANAHQPPSGQYHFHDNPMALRYQLGDHVDFNSVSKIYSESTNAVTKHSPILGWAMDGFPIYGPYGYSVSNDASSGIRRMVSGFVVRNSQYGTSNLTANGRSTIPAWATRLYGVASNVLAGPPVNTTYPLGRYTEDNDYLGDHGYVQGVDFDLDEYNGRWCVTPEFPNGTYAYFITVSTNGTPVYPYMIGFGFYGTPSGGAVTTITETVVTNFLGSTNIASALNAPAANNGTVTLTWSALEGGSYQVEATTNLTTWSTLQTGIAPNKIAGSYTNVTSLDKRFYRVARTGVATSDSLGTTVIAVPAAAPGGIVSRGQTIYLTITLPATPPNPPAGTPVSSVTVGTNVATSATCTTQGIVQALVPIASNAATGAQTVTVIFQNGPTYTLTGGLTVN